MLDVAAFPGDEVIVSAFLADQRPSSEDAGVEQEDVNMEYDGEDTRPHGLLRGLGEAQSEEEDGAIA